MFRYARIKASCDRSIASSRLPTRPSAIKYAFFIYLFTKTSNASGEPRRQRRIAIISSWHKLVTGFGSKFRLFQLKRRILYSVSTVIYTLNPDFLQTIFPYFFTPHNHPIFLWILPFGFQYLLYDTEGSLMANSLLSVYSWGILNRAEHFGHRPILPAY